MMKIERKKKWQLITKAVTLVIVAPDVIERGTPEQMRKILGAASLHDIKNISNKHSP